MSTSPTASQSMLSPGVERLRPLKTPARLIVPCHGCDERDFLATKRPGTLVRRGEPLVDRPPRSKVVPAAPVDARVIGPSRLPRSREQVMAGIVIEPLAVEERQAQGPAGAPDALALAAKLKGVGLAEIADRLAALGVWSDRWSSPDLLAQLRGPHRNPIDTIICNTLDEDPTVPLLANVAADRPSEVVAGVAALAAACGAAKAVVALAYAAPVEAWDGLRTCAGQTGLRLAPINNEYPQSHPTLLIHELTGRHLRPAQLPTDHGVLLLDAAAAATVGRALAFGEPMMSQPIAVHDYLRKTTHFVTVLIGTEVHEVLEQIQVSRGQVELRAGCPLRELPLTPDGVIGGSELTIAIVPARAEVNPEPCIRCAWCVEGCPVNIRPAGLLDAAQQQDLYMAGQCGLDACIECGICSYVCPSHLPLLGGIRVLRALQSPRSEPRG